MQSRIISGLGLTAPYTPFDPFYHPVNLCQLDGYYTGVGNEWLQVHDSAAALAGAEVPAISLPLAATGPFPSMFQTLSPLLFVSGMIFAISSTEKTYTASASEFSFEGAIEEFELPVPGLSSSGDYTTNRTTLAAWNSNIINKMYVLEVINGSGANRYLLLYADGVGDVNSAIIDGFLVPASSKARFVFGSAGRVPQQLLNSAPGQFQSGCLLAVSTSRTALAVIGAPTLKIKLFYKVS